MKFSQMMIFNVFKLIRKKPKFLFYIVVFDLLFIGTIFLLNIMSGLILGKDPRIILDILKTPRAITIFVLFFLLIYSLLVIFIYSFFKYVSLYFITSFFKKIKINFNRLMKFYLFNFLSVVSVFLLFIIISSIFLFIFKREFVKIPIFLIFLIFLFLFYTFISIAHSLFALEFSFKKVIKKSFGFLFRISSYRIYIFDIIILIIYFIIYYLIGLILALVKVNTYKYNFVFSFIGLLMLYFIVLINRFYFYFIVKKSEKQN